MRLALTVALLSVFSCSGSPGTGDGGTGGSAATGGGSAATGGGSTAAGGGSAAGGGTSDAGSGGGVSPGDGGFYGAVRCPTDPYIVCDDFEDAAIDTTTWNIHLATATLTPDTTRAARGNQSLHALTQTGGGDAMVELKAPVALAGQRLWGRMFMYLPARTLPMLQNHSNLATAAGNNDVPTNAVYGAWIGGGKIGSLFYQDTPNVDTSGLGLMTFAPTERWFCVSWDFNGVDNQIRVFFDNQLIPMSELDGYHPPISATLRTGVQFAIEEAWFDSVVWSRTQVGCDQ
jgi:hypothetical protein